MGTMRETVATTLNEDSELADLGLPADSVFQADTLDEPGEFPFLVLRWAQSEPGIAHVFRQPFEIWVYDKPGDYDRTEKIGIKALQVVGAIEQLATTPSGRIMKIETVGAGLGQGRDLFDDAWDAVVIPFRARAVATR